jgi:hypothetical protein
MTQPSDKKDVKHSPIVIFFSLGGWAVLLIWIVFGLVRCVSGDPNISSVQQKRYDDCVAEKQKLGVGIIKADGICDYWKRANP